MWGLRACINFMAWFGPVVANIVARQVGIDKVSAFPLGDIWTAVAGCSVTPDSWMPWAKQNQASHGTLDSALDTFATLDIEDSKVGPDR